MSIDTRRAVNEPAYRNTLLRVARDKEAAQVGAGALWFAEVREAAAEAFGAGGMLMQSASAAGKSYGFSQSVSLRDVLEALDAAERVWDEPDGRTARVAALLAARPVRVKRLSFC